MYQPTMPDTASHASTRRQARTDGGGGEKESSVPELRSLESVCGLACVYRHIARCVFTTIFINHKYSCSDVFNFILPHLPTVFLVSFPTCTPQWFAYRLSLLKVSLFQWIM